MIALLKNKKIKLLSIVFLVTLLTCLFTKYILKLLIPFIIAYLLARFVSLIADKINKKIHFKKGILVGILLLILILIICYLACIIIYNLFGQLGSFFENWPEIQMILNERCQNICGNMDKRVGLSDGHIFGMLSENINSFYLKTQNEIMSLIMNKSRWVLTAIINVIVFVVIMFIAAFFMAKDMDKIYRFKENFIFAKEFKLLTTKLYDVGIAYLRSQLIIMLITTVICYTGLKVLQNPYALLLAMLMGLLEILPIVGIGIFLIPWAIFNLLSGNYFEGVILILIFIVSYIVRELLEPKLIGDRIGIHPLISIVTMYLGYKIFGVIGVFFFLIFYIIIEQITIEVYNKLQ